MHTLLRPDGPTARQTVSASSSGDSDPTVVGEEASSSELISGGRTHARNARTKRGVVVLPDVALCAVHEHCRMPSFFAVGGGGATTEGERRCSTVDVYALEGISVLCGAHVLRFAFRNFRCGFSPYLFAVVWWSGRE